MLLEALEKQVVLYDVEGFYYLARASLVKDERHVDKFDQVFSSHFKGLESLNFDGAENTNTTPQEIPDEWLKKLAEKYLSDEDKKAIEAMGGWDKLMETLKKRLEEQQKRHQGGNKWIGTAGTSPFGAYGYNPEGIRIGQDKGRHGKAVKVWDRREFKNLDDSIEIGTRNIKVALKRLRHWVREGEAEEFDLQGTIRSTAEQGYLDVKTRPERRNAVKLLMFFDVGGSMDYHIKGVEELFSAARAEFKTLEYFYFHNCVYEGVWKNNRRRHQEVIPTYEVMNTYGSDYKVVFIGDAAMSPYEIIQPGGSVEHFNKESGEIWLRRLIERWPSHAWLNPTKEQYWNHTHSIKMIEQLFTNKMYPLTLKGLESMAKNLL